jgi:hypothetical protein
VLMTWRSESWGGVVVLVLVHVEAEAELEGELELTPLEVSCGSTRTGTSNAEVTGSSFRASFSIPRCTCIWTWACTLRH